MKAITLILGLTTGMAVASAALMAAYPDVPRRIVRDSKRAVRCTKRMCSRMFG